MRAELFRSQIRVRRAALIFKEASFVEYQPTGGFLR